MRLSHITSFLIIFLLLLKMQVSYSQKIISFESNWSDSFMEWKVYTEGDSIDGNIDLRWKINKDWTVWDMDLGEFSGTAKMKYSNDPNLWEFRSGNEIINAKTYWSNDFSDWRLNNGRQKIRFKYKLNDLPFIWYSEGEDYGSIDIYPEYNDGLQYWIVEDELSEDISTLYKMAMVFIAMYHSVPKY